MSKLPEEKSDPLWELLKKAPKPPEASPWFVSKVLQRLEEEETPRAFGGKLLALLRHASIPKLATTAALLVAMILLLTHENPAPKTDIAQTDILSLFDDLDNLIAYQDSVLWIDSF